MGRLSKGDPSSYSEPGNIRIDDLLTKWKTIYNYFVLFIIRECCHSSYGFVLER